MFGEDDLSVTITVDTQSLVVDLYNKDGLLICIGKLPLSVLKHALEQLE